MYTDQIFQEAFDEPCGSIPYRISRRLAQLFPERAVVEANGPSFPLLEFAAQGHCSLTPAADVHNQFVSYYRHDNRSVVRYPYTVWFEVDWDGLALDVLVMSVPSACSFWWVVGPTRAAAEHFFATVCAFSPEVQGEVLVFDDGEWRLDEALFRAIRASGRDNLVLEPRLKSALFDDLARFFASESAYRRLGVPWKRGILLSGPPGNGKTHAVKALIQESARPCLYVRNFEDEAAYVSMVFERARRSAPCLLVLEDLDSLVGDSIRSTFLNEMDGFAENRGVVVLATTNHPEKLDPALRDRPSRFDRKYALALPGSAERAEFLRRWVDRWEPAMRPSLAGLDEVVRRTEGLSFATLKELAVASMLIWIEDRQPNGMDATMIDQADELRGLFAPAPADLIAGSTGDSAPSVL